MSIRNIEISAHRTYLGGSVEAFQAYQGVIPTVIHEALPNVELRKVDVYNMGGEIRYTAGTNQTERLIIFNNCTRGNGGIRLVAIKVNGIEMGVELLPEQPGAVAIVDDNNITIAEFFPQLGQLHILFNVFPSFDANSLQKYVDIFKVILTKLYELHFKIITLRHSWKHSQEKEELTNRFKAQLERQARDDIENNKYRLREYENNIVDFKSRIKQNYDNLIRTRKQLEVDESNLGAISSEFIKQLDLVIAHPKVEDLHIKDGKITVYVPKVYAYTKHNDRYYIGNFRVEIQMDNTTIKFFGDNPRRSYWSSQDYHPHVSNNGNPCLGNVASTIAELCSRHEIYALVLICIDYLESVNIDDPAGARVTNWDRVDEDGNILAPLESDEYEYDWTCGYCEEGFHDDDESYSVYQSYTGNNNGEGDWGQERTVCENCREDYYTWYEDLQEYVRDGHCDIIDDEEEDMEDEE